MHRHHTHPGLATRAATTPPDFERMRAAAAARRAGRPLPSARQGAVLRRHLDAIARGDASVSPAARKVGRPR